MQIARVLQRDDRLDLQAVTDLFKTGAFGAFQMGSDLAHHLIELAEREYSLDWRSIQEFVAARLEPEGAAGNSLFDPLTNPSYWYVPVLVGSYSQASRAAVSSDTHDFVTGCVARHYFFDTELSFRSRTNAVPLSLVSEAYRNCRIDAVNDERAAFEERFAAKCGPWLVLLAYGTRLISEQAEHEQYSSAMRAIVLVHSCMQFIDDWNDQDEDLIRLHWNIWAEGLPGMNLSAMSSILQGARASVQCLRPHLLHRVLIAQLADTEREFREIVATVLGRG